MIGHCYIVVSFRITVKRFLGSSDVNCPSVCNERERIVGTNLKHCNFHLSHIIDSETCGTWSCCVRVGDTTCA
jgi:hypothetical protein